MYHMTSRYCSDGITRNPIYAEQAKIIEKCRCAICHSSLVIAHGGFYGYNGDVIKCGLYPEHDGFETYGTIDQVRERLERAGADPEYIEGFIATFYPGRKLKEMAEEGKNVTAIAKYQGAVALNREQAKEVLQACWPNAPEAEVLRAAILCQTYQLNPLMNHVHLVGYKNKEGDMVYSTMIGISATRLCASRRGKYSYVNDTPRVMTTEEQEARLGEADDSKIWVIVQLRDTKTSAEVTGIGNWTKATTPKGTDKGNSKFNMASIRAERQALDRLYPSEMPIGEVFDERYADAPQEEDASVIEGEATDVTPEKIAEDKQEAAMIEAEAQAQVDEETGEILEEEKPEAITPDEIPFDEPPAEEKKLPKAKKGTIDQLGHYLDAGHPATIQRLRDVYGVDCFEDLSVEQAELLLDRCKKASKTSKSIWES